MSRDVDQLCRRRAILDNDATLLHACGEFLLKIRNELHFQAGRQNDVFDRNEQVRIAEKFGYRGDDAVLPVERLMQSYFGYSSQIRYICDQFVANSLARRTFSTNLFAPLITRQVGEQFLMGPTHIGVAEKSLPELSGNLQEILRLMQLASLHDKRVDYDTWEAIRETMSRSQVSELSRPVAEQFMALLLSSNRLADLLQVLHEMFVLEKIIPDFSHARNLMQFNEYHKYTVDEHSLQAVRIATGFADQSTVCGREYKNLKDKHILHLALLLHDLGKGYPEDHCEVGRRIADRIGKRLYLDAEQREDVKFLVHNHLVMTHLAFHRDINEEEMIAEFASNVGSVRMLTLLYLLTCADVDAVGPGVLTPWKYNLLTSLFQKTRHVLTGDDNVGVGNASSNSMYEQIVSLAKTELMRDWLAKASRNLPVNYCQQHDSADVARQLTLLHDTVGNQTQTWIKKCSGNGMFELCIGKRESRRSGIFYRMLGMLASQGAGVRSADIKSLGNSIVFYWFRFIDHEFEEPPASRLEDLKLRAIDLVTGKDEGPPTFRTKWSKADSVARKLARPRIEVKIDNQTVESATIIDVFAYRKMGLLYRIAKKVHQLGLDVSFARISTYAQQMIAVLYVTDEQGSKVRNKNQLQMIKQELYRTTKNYLEPESEA